MTRATPYCSVKPSAMRAYIPQHEAWQDKSTATWDGVLLTRQQADLTARDLPARLPHCHAASARSARGAPHDVGRDP